MIVFMTKRPRQITCGHPTHRPSFRPLLKLAALYRCSLYEYSSREEDSNFFRPRGSAAGQVPYGTVLFSVRYSGHHGTVLVPYFSICPK